MKIVKFSLKRRVAKVRRKRRNIKFRIQGSAFGPNRVGGLQENLGLHTFWLGFAGTGLTAFCEGGTKVRMRRKLRA